MKAITSRQPVAFFGHGAPFNILWANEYTQAWSAFAATLTIPRAVVVISAHWYVPGTYVTAAALPATIHDFNSRFPAELFAFTYPASTDGAVVERVLELLAPVSALPDASTWGIDHGAYSVLAHLFPAADIPVVQVSIDRTKPARYHYNLAKLLAPLRDEGVFVMGSGNLAHNLELVDPRPGVTAFDWAERFDERVGDALSAGDHEALIDYGRLGPDARLSVPTPDHYLPLLYTLALQRDDDVVATIAQGYMGGSVSMRALSIGA